MSSKKCLVSLIETHVECCLNKSNEFVVQREIIISDDETDPSAAQETSSMSLDPSPKENPLNLNDRKQLIQNNRRVWNWSERATFTYIGSKRLLLLRFYWIFQKILEQELTEFMNPRLWENVEQMKMVYLGNSIQVMLMIHANRLQKHFLVPSLKYTKDETIDLLKLYLLYIIICL